MNPALDSDRRLLKIYVWYRLGLAALLFLLQRLHFQNPVLGQEDPAGYMHLALIYFLFNVLSLVFNRDRWASPPVRAVVFIYVDVMMLTLLIHKSGGVTSDLPLLLAVVVAAGNILLRGRLGLLISAVATLALLYEEALLIDEQGLSWQSLNATAFLCLSFFGIAVLSQQLAQRLRQSEALTARQERMLLEMHRMSMQIIQRMRTGILVVDDVPRVVMANDAARILLGLTQPMLHLSLLAEHSPPLASALEHWIHSPHFRPRPFQNHSTSPEISASFTVLDSEQTDTPWSTLIFLEDNTQLAQQAQQLKLASLGRFTASIAHEIRNPMGAISHASQLLAEAPDIQQEDQRLLQIIQQHCRRMNGIIENVLQLSRRERPVSQLFDLLPWLDKFTEEFSQGYGQQATLERQDESPTLVVRFDPDQLFQVLQNLVSNGLRYSLKQGSSRVKLLTGLLDADRPHLDIIDDGPGLSQDIRPHLFEPFFTTETQGTGLGLYLSRELCEANQARLDYLYPFGPGSCFRITFSHPDRYPPVL